jgi:hypothetical protein
MPRTIVTRGPTVSRRCRACRAPMLLRCQALSREEGNKDDLRGLLARTLGIPERAAEAILKRAAGLDRAAAPAVVTKVEIASRSALLGEQSGA